jgi:hypothetical protein
MEGKIEEEGSMTYTTSQHKNTNFVTGSVLETRMRFVYTVKGKHVPVLN